MSNEIALFGMKFANIFVLSFFITAIVYYIVYNIYPLCIHLYESIKALCTNFKIIKLYYLPLEILICLMPLVNLIIIDYTVLEKIPNWTHLTIMYIITGSAIGIIINAI